MQQQIVLVQQQINEMRRNLPQQNNRSIFEAKTKKTRGGRSQKIDEMREELGSNQKT